MWRSRIRWSALLRVPYLNFDSSGKRFPSFKKKALLNDSFTCPQKWRLRQGFVFIPKIGEVKWTKHRHLQGKPKSITISQDGDKWYCSILCEFEIPDKENDSAPAYRCEIGFCETRSCEHSEPDAPEQEIVSLPQEPASKDRGCENKHHERRGSRVANKCNEKSHRYSLAASSAHSVVWQTYQTVWLIGAS